MFRLISFIAEEISILTSSVYVALVIEIGAFDRPSCLPRKLICRNNLSNSLWKCPPVAVVTQNANKKLSLWYHECNIKRASVKRLKRCRSLIAVNTSVALALNSISFAFSWLHMRQREVRKSTTAIVKLFSRRKFHEKLNFPRQSSRASQRKWKWVNN